MVKRILLNCDEEFFYKLKKDKLKREEKHGARMSWDTYLTLLFAMREK